VSLKSPVLVALVLLIFLCAALGFYFLSAGSTPPPYNLIKAVRREIRVVVSTNGIIEPVDRSEIYAPVDGFVTSIQKKEGEEILQGRLLMQLDSEQVRTALAEASAALLAAKRQARVVEIGPSKEEIVALDASISEGALQLDQLNKDLADEEALYAKQATPRISVENLRKQRDLLQLRAEALKQKKQDLLARYSAEDKAWEQGRIEELTKEVESLKRQLHAESVLAPRSGLIYSLQVKQGSYVNKGQLLAQIYKPGDVLLRAYVDEPDLGRIRRGQPVRIEWNGLPNQHWTGVVDKPAEQVVPLNNRSVGHVLCSIVDGPEGLIPNLNVRVEITTNLKEDALVIPKSAVFNHDGKPTVLLSEKTGTVTRPVDLGLVSPEEIEILRGISEGDTVVLNPSEARGN
jgi:HlyD family secretion protein